MALTDAKNVPTVAGIMLVAYPAWDAIANLDDDPHEGGNGRSKTQSLNVIVSAIAAVGVAVALGDSFKSVLVVFGVWAGFAGLLQFAAAARRWKAYGAEWAMILSGVQSTLAGFFIAITAGANEQRGFATITAYAAFGALYFLVAALWLTVKDARNNPPCGMARWPGGA